MNGLRPDRPEDLKQIEAQIRLALESLRFGAIELVVHDGCVVQIERRERMRFEHPATPDPRTSPPR